VLGLGVVRVESGPAAALEAFAGGSCVTSDARRPPHAAPACMQDCEQRLLLECGRCPSQHALMLAATALVQPDGSRQLALLQVGGLRRGAGCQWCLSAQGRTHAARMLLSACAHA
jgi:hypothetical protein